MARPKQKSVADALAPVDQVASGGIPTHELTPLEWHALAHAAKKAEKVRDALKVGTGQTVQFTVEIDGQMDVGSGQSSEQTDKPKPAAVLAVVLAALGPANRERALAAVREKFAESLEPAIDQSAVDLADMALLSVGRSATKTKRGNVTGSLIVKVLKRASKAA